MPYSVTSIYFRDEAEYRHFHDIRVLGFTHWYVGRDRPKMGLARMKANARTGLFPDFFYQVRTEGGRAIAYLATVPGYWSGDAQALQDLQYHADAFSFPAGKLFLLALLHAATVEALRAPWLFDAAMGAYRREKLSGCNSIVLTAMTVDPAYQRSGIPALLLSAVRATARRLRMRHIIAPLRPNAYGSYKAERRAAHSNALFEEYCGSRNPEGLPRDPWLRSAARMGARFLKIEPRSFRVTRSLDEFEAFRQRHNPDRWYSTAADVWECGETPTWYVDRGRKQAVSVEPNLWGAFPVDAGDGRRDASPS
jgi:GNAT superfamily N-acetyltransferase